MVCLPNTEICLCAAIKMPDGEVIRGHRHDSCYDVVRRRCAQLSSLVKREEYRLEILKAEQGFLTTYNRFVDRRQGMVLMKASGLRSHYSANGKYSGDLLFSEDLYPNGPSEL